METKIGEFIVRTVLDEEPDDDPRDPDSWDNLGKMLFKHKNYNLPQETTDEELKKARVVLPVYMLDHSGITFSMEDFHDPWDSGLIGYIAAFDDDIRRYFEVKRITSKVIEMTKQRLAQEVQDYDQFVRGEIYGFEVVKKNEDGEEEIVDSCYGYYGEEDAMIDGKDSARCMSEATSEA